MEFLSRLPDVDGSIQHKEYISGPFIINGSDYFMCMFKYGKHENKKGEGTFTQKLYQLPDSQMIPMLLDAS